MKKNGLGCGGNPGRCEGTQREEALVENSVEGIDDGDAGSKIGVGRLAERASGWRCLAVTGDARQNSMQPGAQRCLLSPAASEFFFGPSPGFQPGPSCVTTLLPQDG